MENVQPFTNLRSSLVLPYGETQLVLPDDLRSFQLDLLLPNHVEPGTDPFQKVYDALYRPLGVDLTSRLNSGIRVGLCINDKTRPVPNNILVAPLLDLLHTHGIPDSNITFFIANGTHVPMKMEEIGLIISPDLIGRHTIISHNCDDHESLLELGSTSSGTPVLVNKRFHQQNLKIVIGDIELHHFAGFSGGVKSAAIGLCGRQTINANHRWLLDDRSQVGNILTNPLRADIEEIGKIIGVDLALNAVLNEKKEIIDVFFGDPVKVMQAGINTIRNISQIAVTNQYDVVIASAGGYPKDINLYQSQKAMTHASLFCRPGGCIILAAECREGIGSRGYSNFMCGLNSIDEVILKFTKEGFSVGPHKAYQIARILQKNRVFLASSLPEKTVRSLLMEPLKIKRENVCVLDIPVINADDRIALLPFATACIPVFVGGRIG